MHKRIDATTGLAARFARLGIGLKLAIAFGTVLLLSLAAGGYATLALGQVHGASSALVTRWMPAVHHLTGVRSAMLEVRESEVKHASAPDASYRAEYQDKADAALKTVTEGLAAYAALPAGAPDSEGAKAFQAFGQAWKAYLEAKDKVMGLSNGGQSQDARDISDGAAKMALDDSVGALDRLIAFNFASGRADGDQAGVVYGKARIALGGLVGAALLAGLALSVLITRSLTGQLGGEPHVASQVAAAVARGDLSTSIRVHARDSDSLMARLRLMQSGLTEVVSTVRQSADLLAVATGEIAQGNHDLSTRTEHQATALQETASSMGQLDEAVDKNAQTARSADALARQARQVAGEGGQAVTRVVETMREMNASSRRIADITGVIDGIAFQTNILALNAAVEAARAGEQGRGFAVVASEVRSLAQRSAESAKQIRELIAESVQRVEQGCDVADAAGSTMRTVVDSIEEVAQLVRQISEASHDQSHGLKQVREAVTRMDETTQQNAALVEQGAAAAQSLRDQADRLVQAVSVFRLAGAS